MKHSQNLAGHRARLRQRFIECPKEFSDVHILELVLTYAIPRRDVQPISMALMERFGSLGNVLAANQEELTKIDGIGEVVSILILAINDIQARLSTANSSNHD